MKKFIFIPVFLILLSLISFKDYSVCNGINNSYKAIACNACHNNTSAGSNVVVVGGGKNDVEIINTDSDNKDFDITVKLPTVDLQSVQISSSFISKNTTKPLISLNNTTTVLNNRNITLFNNLNLSSLNSGKKENDNLFTLNYHFNEAITSAQTLVIQGVISNNDGTPNGDQTFYKEIIIEPKNIEVEDNSANPMNLDMAYEDYYYNNNQLIISSLSKKQVRVIDLQGKVVIDQQVNDYTNIDVAHLTTGNYFVVIGSKGKEMQSFQFAK